MEEKYIGKDALANYSFRDVALKQPEALRSLTQRTSSVFASNIDAVVSKLKAHPLSDPNTISKLESAKREGIGQGGSSMSGEELRQVYEDWGNLTFKDIVGKFIREVFPLFLEDKSLDRNTGNICVGYLLDILRIIDPRVATFDDGVRITIESIRESSPQFSFFLLGAMIDDSANLRGTEDLSIDFMVDSEGAKQLKDSLLRFVGPGEKQEFENGISITRAEMHNGISIREKGFSLN